MILSDVSIRKALSEGRIEIDPLDEAAIQPSSVDLRVDRYFRVFRNDTTPFIDPRENQENLTELVEVADEGRFILHPGEFVLGSTLERVKLPDDMVARLEGKSSLGRLGLLIHSSLPASERVLLRDGDHVAFRTMAEIVSKHLRADVVAFDPENLAVDYHPITGWYEGPADRIYEVRLASGRSVRVTAGHNLFTLDCDGRVVPTRTCSLRPGTRVVIPRRIPEPFAATGTVEIDVLALAPEREYGELVVAGPGVRRGIAAARAAVAGALRDRGTARVEHWVHNDRLPLDVARLVGSVRHALGAADRLLARGGRNSIPLRITLDHEVTWLLGLYVARGARRRDGVTWSHADRVVLDRAAAALATLGLSVHRAPGSVTARSGALARLIDWLEIADDTGARRMPTGWLTLPVALLESFLDGLVDGSGCRGAARACVRTPSANLVDDLLFLAERLGRPASSQRCTHACRPLTEVRIGRRELAPLGGDLHWDRVVEVADTGRVEPVYDIEVRPGRRAIENFLAGTGGVFVSNTAGFVDSGWDGHLTLELSNVANLPIAIYPGMKIGQISFLQMTSPAEHPYGSSATGSKYQGQRGPTPSRYYLNFQGRSR